MPPKKYFDIGVKVRFTRRMPHPRLGCFAVFHFCTECAVAPKANTRFFLRQRFNFAAVYSHILYFFIRVIVRFEYGEEVRACGSQSRAKRETVLCTGRVVRGRLPGRATGRTDATRGPSRAGQVSVS
jgi:hypothetical protein